MTLYHKSTHCLIYTDLHKLDNLMIDTEILNGLKVTYHTFGCKLNFAETSSLADILESYGVIRAADGDTPDVIIINSCSVTELADKKCRQTIRSYHRRYPHAFIIVTGCYAQLKSHEVAAIEGVKAVTGSNQKMHIAESLASWIRSKDGIVDVTPLQQIREFSPSCSRGDRTRYFLKVQDGCDYWCTYCTIPRARGRSRSATIPEVVAEARKVAMAGGKEIVITGVNIGDFGKGRTDSFFDLIKELDKVDGIRRYRISSIEPNLLTDEIIDWCAQSEKFMPHFHIPLQSGSDEVLALMHRHYDTAFFRKKIERLRSVIPHAFIGVDLIVGARGETCRHFLESKAFVESLDISRLHVFPYSERPGTRALEINHVVSDKDKHERDKTMIALSDDKLRNFSLRFLNSVRPVLMEHPRPGHHMAGFTDNYLRVNVVDADTSLDNQIVNVSLDSLNPATNEFTGKIHK